MKPVKFPFKKAPFTCKYEFKNDEVRNEYVAERLHELLWHIIQLTNNVGIKIIPEDKMFTLFAKEKIIESRFGKDKEYGEEYYLIRSETKEDVDKVNAFLNMTIETLLDYWLKFNMKNFYFEWGVGKSRVWSMIVDRGFTNQDMKNYWFKNDTNGWNVQGRFWKREWFDENRHKRVSTDGGAKL